MRLEELLAELLRSKIGVVEERQFKNQKMWVLGFIPRNPTGPQYPLDVTESTNPEITEKEAEIIRRRFQNS